MTDRIDVIYVVNLHTIDYSSRFSFIYFQYIKAIQINPHNIDYVRSMYLCFWTHKLICDQHGMRSEHALRMASVSSSCNSATYDGDDDDNDDKLLVRPSSSSS